MKTIPRLKPYAAALSALALSVGALLPSTTHASSHMDAPLVTLDPAANTTDLYAF